MSENSKSLLSKTLTIAPGVFDGMSTLLVNRAGFSAVYASGGAIARSKGVPDIGLLTLTEVVEQLKTIVDASDVPVIADADTGFGNELNVERTIQEFERIDIAAMHIEDQTFPKRCGHLNNKTLIPTEEMCHKIKVAVNTRKSSDLLIIARTDAIAVEGFDAAIERAKAYAAAGADMLFVEAPETREQIEAIAKALPQPKLINMFYGGKTPLVPAKDLEAMGFSIAIIPSDLQRASIHAMQSTLEVIKKDGDSKNVTDNLVTFNEREEIIKTQSYFERTKM